MLHATRTTASHDTNILPDMSLTGRDTPRPFQPPVAQSDVKAEVAHCVGGVISPVIANLFLHYASGMWITRTFPGVAFERYVDDAVIHCATERQAREVLAALQERMSEVGLALHPDKTRIVYCQDARRRGSHEHTSFTFLGYGFRGRRVRTRSGRITTGFVPAISKDALNKISSQVRSWRLHIRTGLSEADLARRINPVVRGSPGAGSLLHDVA